MRRIITTVVVLLAVLVLVDRVAVTYAQHRVATTLRNTEHLTSTPKVKIHGFPFLTQLARERFSDVEVIVTDFSRGRLVRIDRLDVHLRDARVNISEAVRGGATRVPVKRVDGTATIGYSSLSRVHDGLTFSYAGGDSVRVTGGISVAGQRVTASAIARMVLVSDGLSVAIDSVTGAGTAATAVIDAAARRAFGVSTALPTFPFHFTLNSVRATSSGVEVSGTASNVVLTTG
jgi:hypothetical protein